MHVWGGKTGFSASVEMTIFDRFGGRTKAKENAGFSTALFAKGRDFAQDDNSFGGAWGRTTADPCGMTNKKTSNGNSKSLRDDKQKDKQRQ